MARKRPLRKAEAPSSQRGYSPPQINPEFQAAIMKQVDTQLQTRIPPEVWETFERLTQAGYTAEGARQLIAHAVVNEIVNVMAQGQPYHAARYIAALRRLPQLSEADSSYD